jgi:hypothetical protein
MIDSPPHSIADVQAAASRRLAPERTVDRLLALMVGCAVRTRQDASIILSRDPVSGQEHQDTVPRRGAV